MAPAKTCHWVRMNTSLLGWNATAASGPSATCGHVRFSAAYWGMSGLISDIAKPTQLTPKRSFRRGVSAWQSIEASQQVLKQSNCLIDGSFASCVAF